MSNDSKHTHPSYGIVSFSRISSSGKKRLFGSTLDMHYHSIVLELSEAELCIDHELLNERVCAGKSIVRVEMSAAQFAELLTTMNIGEGVPCTIERRDGKGVDEPPFLPTESENVRTDFASKMRDIGKDLRRRADEVMAELPASLKTSTRRQIEIKLGNIVGTITDNAPFALTQFQEAATRVTTAAKAEVEAVLTHAVQMTGINALRRAVTHGEPLALPAHDDSEVSQ